jgi:hypothetical protein
MQTAMCCMHLDTGMFYLASMYLSFKVDSTSLTHTDMTGSICMYLYVSETRYRQLSINCILIQAYLFLDVSACTWRLTPTQQSRLYLSVSTFQYKQLCTCVFNDDLMPCSVLHIATGEIPIVLSL